MWRKFGVGVGTIVLGVNATLLSGYSASCHVVRHLLGGNRDSFSSLTLGRARHRLWDGVSRLNAHHMLWAWMSLFSVGFADLYVRLCSMGIWIDFRIF